MPRPGSFGARPPPRHAGLYRHVDEARAVVAEESVGIAVHVGDRDVEIAVLIRIEPHRADRPAGIGQAERGRLVAEDAAVVAEERVGAVAKRHEQVEIAVALDIHPHRLAHGAGGECESGCRRGVGEDTALVAIEAQHRGARRRREADQQVGIAVRIRIAKGGCTGRARLGQTGGGRDVGEDAAVVAVEPVGLAVEAHEEIEIAVAVSVGKRVDEAGAGGKQIRLQRGEVGQRLHEHRHRARHDRHRKDPALQHGAW